MPTMTLRTDQVRTKRWKRLADKAELSLNEWLVRAADAYAADPSSPATRAEVESIIGAAVMTLADVKAAAATLAALPKADLSLPVHPGWEIDPVQEATAEPAGAEPVVQCDCGLPRLTKRHNCRKGIP